MAYNKETGKFHGYIYLILNDVKPEKIYVGQTASTPQIRWNGHVGHQLKKHTHTDKLHNAMCKYGTSHFCMEVIEEHKFKTKEELICMLNERERYYIKLFNSYENGYNSTRGGRDSAEHVMRPVSKYDLYGNYIDSYESIDSLKQDFDSVHSIYECCSGVCKYAYGHVWRYKEDDILKFELPNEEEINIARTKYLMLKPIDKYDYKGNKLKTYKNAKDLLSCEHINRSQLANVCNGIKIHHNTYIYRFSCDKFNTYRTYTDKPKMVEQYDLNGNFIKVFASSREAARSVGLKGTSVSSVCRGKQKTAGGFMWKYVEEGLELPDLEHNGHCKKIYAYSKDGALVNIYASIQDAAIDVGLNVATISKQACGKTQCISTDFVFSFEELQIEDIQNKSNSKMNKSVCQYTKDDVFIKQYHSLKEAGKSFDSPNANVLIGSCCRKIKKSAYGYKWYFTDDSERPNKVIN